MSARSLRLWVWVHKWTSLVCMVFMLLLCLTGLPLIFTHEIHHLAGDEIEAQAMPEGTPRANLEHVVSAAQAYRPGLVPLYLFAEADAPDLWLVKLDTRVNTDESKARFATVDARTAEVLGAPTFGQGFMNILFRLHVDMFFALPGKLFLGLMGLLLVLSVISGVVLYGPFMRKLDFGTVRRGKTQRVTWLDIHNLLGIVTLVWTLIVGGTGVINTLADLILKSWQNEQIQKLLDGQTQSILAPEPARNEANRTGVQYVVTRAEKAVLGMRVDMIAFPGTLRSTPKHFAVILRGNTPLTSRLSEAVLIDPLTGEVLQAGTRPWYVTLLQLSQPLHFGDYGGMPLKVLWAWLDIITTIVLYSGLYLWWTRGKQTKEATPAERILPRSVA